MQINITLKPIKSGTLKNVWLTQKNAGKEELRNKK